MAETPLSASTTAPQPSPAAAPERVLTVHDYYDGPRCGIAFFNGAAHWYDAVFDAAADDYSGIYALQPIDDALLALAMEDWAIWLRWHAAQQAGEVPLESHPALPADRLRHAQLTARIGNRLRPDPPSDLTSRPTPPLRMRASFTHCAAPLDMHRAVVVWRAA
jgi:hypothetical protein